MEFIKQLRRSAFDALDATNHKVDLDGWMAPQFGRVVDKFFDSYKKDHVTIIEVGTWKGLSASTLATKADSYYPGAFDLICIDTWLGAPEFWTWGNDDDTRGKSLNKIHGYPSVFYTFTKNMKALGHNKSIAPLPLPSSEAIHVLKHYNIQADLIYIDGSHEYESVKADLNNYWSILKPGGMMFGDDYMPNTWDGVVKAVTEFPALPTIDGVVWSFRK